MAAIQPREDTPISSVAICAGGLPTFGGGTNNAASKWAGRTGDERFPFRYRNQRNRSDAANAPASWKRMNPGTSEGRMPANVFVMARASVTAGFAKEVDEVNQ